MGPDPHITVVLPTRDRVGFLADALSSALGQSDVDLEVVVVDDGSTDATPSLLARNADERLRVVRHPRPRGVAAARNHAIELARGAWLAFLDDDDLWAPTWLSAACRVAEREGADIVYGSQLVVNRHRDPIEVALAERSDGLAGRLRQINALGGPSGVIARTQLVRSAGGFDPAFSVLADWDLWLRITQQGRAVGCAEVLVGYTLHGRNMQLVDARNALAEHRALRAKHAREPDAFDVLWLLRWMANQNRRYGRRRVAAELYLEAVVRHRSLSDLLRLGAALFGSSGGASLEQSPYLAPDWLRPYAAGGAAGRR